ncbi:hypothetical protein [Phytoactinopolyspora halotolerans]|uniref:Uncharacterized protein n=1 Tax=Phytoactinopolyspora halotolerans TaxID=1981512 RepID=A0A6L9SC80_9ACTN|nr:hypothetical protein [Phytoactinopolyspora halotolerans]NEE02683.1 hypothetical protein [Phytoactinopolyspora halotolerans]
MDEKPAHHAWARVAALTITAALGVGVAAQPAQAHPFGEPQTVQLSADAEVVTVRWSAPADDLLVLGGVSGALPDRREIVFDVGPTAAPEPVGETDAERLTSSRQVAAYLAERISVRQSGEPCAGKVRLDELVGDGAELTFSCPEPVTVVDIEVATLTDVHEAYRTAAIGDGSTSPGRALYTVDDDVQTWEFGVAATGTGPSITAAAWIGAAIAALAGAAWTARAKGRRKDRAVAPGASGGGELP